jgi:hypothetical protein
MKITACFCVLLFAAVAAAQEIDPGWSRKAEYIAATGDTNLNYAAAMAWDEAQRKATPLVFDQPLQARIETPATDGHVYGLEVDPTSGAVVPVQRESTRKTQAQYEADRAAAFALSGSIVDALKTLKPTMTNNIAQAQAAKAAWQAVDPTAWTGAQRTQMQAVKAAGIAAANQAIDDAQAVNLFRRTLLRFYKVEEQ